MTPRRLALVVILCLGIVYLAIILASPRHAFWTIDGGFKFLTVEQLSKSSFQSASLPYPGSDIDPDGEFFPIKPPMATRVRGEFLPDVSLPFPILTAPLYGIFSTFGLYLLPVLGTLILLWLTYLLIEPEIGNWAPVSILLVGLATPIFFYAVTFWEHNLTVLATTAAVLVLVRSGGPVSFRRSLAAGVLLGAAIWFREECYVFTASALLAMLVTRTGFRAILGAACGSAAGVAPLLFLQWRVLEKPFGMRIQGATEFGLASREAGEGISGYLVDRIETLYAWTLGLHPDAARTLWVSLPLLAGLVLFLLFRRRKLALMMAWAATAIYAVLCFVTFSDFDERVFSTYFSGGLFPTAPVIAALLAAGFSSTDTKRSWKETYIGMLVLIFFCSSILLSPIKYQRGVHWGPRYLLPILPLIVALGLTGVRRAAAHLRFRAATLALGVLILALSFVIQTHGIASLATKKLGTARTIALVREDTREDIVTNVWWFPLEIPAAFRDRRIYLVTDTEDFRKLLARFRASRIDHFTLVASPTMDQILRDPLISIQSIRPHVNPSMSYFDLLFCECALKNRE